MSKPLFSEFPPVSAKAFKQKIQYDLDGAEYNETLVWNAPEGISVRKLLEANEDIIFRKLEPSEHMSFRSIGAVGTCAVKRILLGA